MILALLVVLSAIGLWTAYWLLTVGTQPHDFPPNAPAVIDVPVYTFDHTGLT